MCTEEQPRLLHACLLEAPQSRVWVVNTHFSHKPWSSEQSHQARQCCDFIKKELLITSTTLSNPKAVVYSGEKTCSILRADSSIGQSVPVLLCGDFNSPPWLPGAAYQTVSASGGCDLWDAHRANVVTCPTWYHSLGRPNLSWLLAGRIDHIFCFTDETADETKSSMLHCQQMIVVRNPRDVLLASDHCPVVADVECVLRSETDSNDCMVDETPALEGCGRCRKRKRSELN
eukprot:gnl/TRDRNA2_/TRDRNA2_90562_c1_seq1.p1 gnl/TRDRNA2_/TRDRNA2_90562_c1~~gnl/TRDRNA2_/TRDRNA2_90562_c1_seq1.p1  ORF type:complete len:231 (+),score=4.24 gnl/TRDRNA2_/TRDRNA2_90562_c1_seq1:194-886(+)